MTLPTDYTPDADPAKGIFARRRLAAVINAISAAVNTGGGNGASGAVVRGPFPFAFNSPNIATGHAFYTPTVGDILLDAWIEVTTAWDGTTPKADIGTFIGASAGLRFETLSGPIDMTSVDDEPNGTGYLLGENGNISLAGNGNALRPVPGRFTAANPFKVCVTQTGRNNGAATGATQGAANLYLVTATPVAP